MRLRTKIIIVNIIVLIGLIVGVFISKDYIKNNLVNYMKERYEIQLDILKEKIEDYYTEKKTMNDDKFKKYMTLAYKNVRPLGIEFYVVNKNGKIVFKTINYHEIFEHYNIKRYTKEQENYQEKKILKVDNEVIGRLYIKYKFNNGLSLNDNRYIDNFINMYMGIVFIIILISLISSVIVVTGVTNPINKVVSIAKKLSKGDFRQKIETKSTTKEIIDLENSINNLAASLEEEDKIRKQMTSDISHEIRTPVNNVMNNLEAILDDVFELNKENIKLTYNETLRIASLVDKLKYINSIESKNIILNNEFFDVKEYVESIVNGFKGTAKNKNINIKLQGKNLKIYMDKEIFAQILNNLISNGIRYSNENSKINVKLCTYEKIFKIEVEDFGIGIEEKHIKNIFNRFYRTDESRNKYSGGMGLGLSVVKNLVERYNGKIWAESKIGEGSKFFVELPVIAK